jgi:diaminopimelate decarboxylase
MLRFTDNTPCIPPNIIKEIAAEYPTPFYLYSEKQILADWNAVINAFSWQDRFRNYFPMRENYNPVILKTLWNAGCGILACGRSELLLAKRLGFCGDRLIYQPMRIDPDTEEIAAELDVSWLITAPELLMTVSASTVILRYAPDTKSHPRFKHTCFDRLKSGLNKYELFDTLLTLHVRNTPVVGLELQMKAFDLQSDACLTRIKLLYSLVDEILQRTDVKIAILNPGDDTVPGRLNTISDGLKNFIQTVPETSRPMIHTTFSHMILNPGSYLVSEVISVRDLQQNHLVLDASCGQFLRGALLNSSHDICIIRRRRTKTEQRCCFVDGATPENYDRLSSDMYSIKATPEDLCVIFDMGCSTRSMPMLQHFTPICPEFMLHADGTVEQIAAGKSDEEILEFLTT